MSKEKIWLLVVSIIIIILYFGIKTTKENDLIIQDDIDKHTVLVVGKLKDRKRYFTDFIYYYEGQKFKGSVESSHVNKNMEGKFFKVELSSKSPNFSRILLSQEINDTAQINLNGFRKKTLTEILNDTTSGNSR